MQFSSYAIDYFDLYLMKLCLDEDEESRPPCLTENFFNALMIAESKKKGVFQLLSFKKKKDLVFSTKISDGFFEVKVMMVQEAARQLEAGLVKDFSILDGWMRNHGDGMLIVREKMKYWSHQRMVGAPLSWRMKRENVNTNGSNLIPWLSQEVKSLHVEQSNLKNQTSNNEAGNQTQPVLSCFPEIGGEEREDVPVEKKESRSLDGVTQTQSLCDAKIPKRETSVQQNQWGQVAASQQIQQTTYKSLNNRVSDKRTDKPLSKRTQIILNLLFQSDDQQSQKNKQQKIVEQKTFPLNQSKTSLSSKSDTTIDLQFIFNALTDEETPQTLKKEQKGSIEEKKEEEVSEDDEVFLDWLNQKKQSNRKSIKVATPLRQSVQQKRQEMYRHLMSSSDEEPQQSQTSKKVFVNISKVPFNPLLEDLSQVKLQNVFHGIYPKRSTNWWTSAYLICLGEPTPKDYSNAILVDESKKYFFSAVFLNLSTLKDPLEEGSFYFIGKGLIKSNNDPHHRVSQCQIQLDCSQCIIQKVPEEKESPIEPSEHYTSINQLYKLEQGEIVNIFGVIKSVRSISGKNGLILNYEIVDPINSYSIVLTQFDSRTNPEELPQLTNSAVTVYQCGVGSYKGKKNLVTKLRTIIKHNWLPLAQEAIRVREWLQQQSNKIQDIELNLVNFIECDNLVEAAACASLQVYIKNVTILQINSKYTYLACVKCFKKVQEGRCRACGKRGNKEIIERLFLRGVVGDESTHTSILWANHLAESIVSSGFAEFQLKWLLSKVSIWMQKGNNDSLTIVKMKPLALQERIADLFAFIASRTL